MRKFIRLLALSMAAAMLLSVSALAAGNDAGGPKLVWNWLDWDEGHFVSDDALSGRNYGDGEMHIAPGDECRAIFFAIGEDGRRTPVIPKAGKGVTIEKLDKEEIASGAKQSEFYVLVRMDGWGESEITSGKAAMRVVAELPDAGFYTTAEATREGYLRNDRMPYDPAQLSDKTVYFIRSASDDPNQRQITDVKKNSNGNSAMYDLEKISGNVWKITLKIGDEGGVGVSLDVTFREAGGRTYTEERGCGFEYPRGPELWKEWLSWEEDPADTKPESEIHGGDIDVVPAGQEYHLAFYTCEGDGEKLTPVPVDQLKAGKGVTIEPLAPDDPEKSHYAVVTVADWDKTYVISCGEYTVKLKSHLPEVAIYSEPEVSTDTFLRTWRYTAIQPRETVYVGLHSIEEHGRTPVGVELADFENSGQFTLKKQSDTIYQLTKKSLELPDGDVWFDVTYQFPDGTTEVQREGVWLEPWGAVVVSERELPNTYDSVVLYDSVKDQLSDSITLKAGETKTVYIGHILFQERWGGWRVIAAAPVSYCAGGDLKLEAVPGGGKPPQYTLSGSAPGTYQLGVSDWTYAVYDKNGKDVTEELEAQDIYIEYDFDKGEWYLIDAKGDEPVPYEFDGRIEIDPGEMYREWYAVTVTVTGGETPKPAASFSDVSASAWYASAVAFASANGYMNGNPDGAFAPSGRINAAQFAQILYNKEGKPAAGGASFQGVDSQWYAAPILWAAGSGIVTDTGDAAVEPTRDLTRQQIALMLYNYMDKPAGGAELTGFTDADQVSPWALDAVKWAVGEGILRGSNQALNPNGTATRAETAQILMNFFG